MKSTVGAEKGKVYLVGAGPGDPELLTVRALGLLQTSDVVFHDDLVPMEILALVRSHAVVTSVGKRCGRARVTQAEIHHLLVEAARNGQSVVRLKSGDPLIFGRASEEIDSLRAERIPFEIVPGVTAALAAASVLALPLTDRRAASKLIFCTGHHATDNPGEKQVWSGKLPADATLVIYMPGRDMARLTRELSAAQIDSNVPVCAISHVASPRQSHATCRFGSLTSLHLGPAPLLLLIGGAIEPLLATDDAGDEFSSILQHPALLDLAKIEV